MKSEIVQCKSTSLLIQNVKEELSNAGYKSGTILVENESCRIFWAIFFTPLFLRSPTANILRLVIFSGP